jgi:hypothetical protein
VNLPQAGHLFPGDSKVAAKKATALFANFAKLEDCSCFWLNQEKIANIARESDPQSSPFMTSNRAEGGCSMSEVATRWVSPFWTSVSSPAAPEGGPGEKVLAMPQVFVLNLGAQAKFSVHWFSFFGDPIGHEEGSLMKHELGGPYAPTEGFGGRGWMRVISASPILPWGITPVFPTTGAELYTSSPSDEATELLWVNMTFHPEDAVKFPDITLQPVPHA